MLRRLPVIPTLLVLAAVAVMVRLGFWQIDRMHQKEAMLDQFRLAASSTEISQWPSAGDRGQARQALQYRKVQATCARVIGQSATAGFNAAGESGWRHLAFCEMAQGYNRGEVVLGWSRNPQSPVWQGGAVQGTFVMAGQSNARVFADPPLAGLEPNARPDPNDLPNNHLAYAVQWFLFALTALVIYALALRKRLSGN